MQLSIEIILLENGSGDEFYLRFLYFFINLLPTNCSNTLHCSESLTDTVLSSFGSCRLPHTASLVPVLERTNCSDIHLQWHLSLDRNGVRNSSGKSYISTTRHHRRSRRVHLRRGTWLTFSHLSLTVSGTVATFMIQLKEVCGDFC